MRLDTSLTQSEVNLLELGSFIQENGIELEVPPIVLVSDVSPGKDFASVDITPCEVPKDAYVFPLDISLQFVPDHY